MKKTIFILSAFLYSQMIFAGDRLSGDELRGYFSDKTIHGVHHIHGNVKSAYGNDGSWKSHSKSTIDRQGKWWIDGDRRCVQVDGEKKKHCHFVERNEDGTHTLIHGKNGKQLLEIKSTEDGNTL